MGISKLFCIIYDLDKEMGTISSSSLRRLVKLRASSKLNFLKEARYLNLKRWELIILKADCADNNIK